jgi:hypothetical protein
MNKNQPSCLKLIVINLLVLVVLLFLVEMGVRFSHRTQVADPHPIIWMQFQPYVMTSNGKGRWTKWHDSFRDKLVDADVMTNNYGYPMREDFQITESYKKAKHEKVVLFTGGSAAWGVGASSNATIIHEKLASFLNKAQKTTHYTVINLAMGGWIAQQEAIALDLWGRLYAPDWVVAMDGANDASVGCAMSQGTGNPVHYQIMKSYIDGYLGSQERPSFYRSYWENQLIFHSDAYRTLTKKQYIPRNQEMEPSGVGSLETKKTVVAVTPLSELRNQLAFYVLAQRSILERFQDAKFILSTQPWQQDFEFIFGSFYKNANNDDAKFMGQKKYEEELENWLEVYRPTENQCSGEKVGVALRYVYGMSAIKLDQLVDEYKKTRRRDVEYFNLGLLLPRDTAKRSEYFIDSVHLNDIGLDMMARYYAYNILSRDFPAQNWNSMRPDSQQLK